MYPGVCEFLEIIAEELVSTSPIYLTAASLSAQGHSSILDDLQKKLKVTTGNDAITSAVNELTTHFQDKDARLPFDFDVATAKFTALDLDYLTFITDMKAIRTIGKHSRQFECSVAHRLKLRATGAIHRVGYPRDIKKRKIDFNAHLKTLGFERPVLLDKEKDGGLDILWQLPLGTVPHRPFVFVQCKNGRFEMKVADGSLASGDRSLSQHGGLMSKVHIPCVLFNDYIWPALLGKKQLNYVPLGLSDLASLSSPANVELI